MHDNALDHHLGPPGAEQGLELPRDDAAEWIVTGLATDSPRGASSVSDLDVADFIDPRLAVLWKAAVECSTPYRFDGTRTREISAAAGVPFQLAEAARSTIPALYDAKGWWVRRVRDAAARRRLMAELATAFTELGTGATLEEATSTLERCRGIARGEAVGQLVEARRAAA